MSALNHLSFSLGPVPPFRLDLTAWALRRRPDNGIDSWDGRVYRRVLVIDGRPVAVAVTQEGRPARPRLHVELTATRLPPDARASVTVLLERMLGLRTNLRPFYRLAARDPQIATLVRRFRGAKPPRFPTVFEAVVNGIACQQLSLLVGLLLLNRLAQRFGLAVRADDTTGYAFPRSLDLASATPSALRKLGFSAAKARALIEVSAAIVSEGLELEVLSALDNIQAVDWLYQLRGIGRWTAEYVLLRGLGRLDVFPGDDVGARNNLARFIGRRRPLDYDGVRRAVAGWQPYAGFLYFHLLLDRIHDAGWLPAV